MSSGVVVYNMVMIVNNISLNSWNFLKRMDVTSSQHTHITQHTYTCSSNYVEMMDKLFSLIVMIHITKMYSPYIYQRFLYVKGISIKLPKRKYDHLWQRKRCQYYWIAHLPPLLQHCVFSLNKKVIMDLELYFTISINKNPFYNWGENTALYIY